MATKKDYAKWALMLIEGDDYIVSDLLEALLEDGYINAREEWDEERSDNNDDE